MSEQDELGIIGHDGYRILEINKKNNNVASNSGANFNGSPVKHNAETALADARQNNPFAQIA